MFGNTNAVNLFNQASKKTQSQSTMPISSQEKPVIKDQIPKDAKQQSIDTPIQGQKIINKQSNPFMNKGFVSQPKIALLSTNQNNNIFATSNKGLNIFQNSSSEKMLNKPTANLFNQPATTLLSSFNNPQTPNIFSSPVFEPKIETKQLGSIFETKKDELDQKNDKNNLTNKADVTAKQNPFSLANKSNNLFQQKSVFETKPSPQGNSLFGAKNQLQKSNIFSGQSKTPNTLFGSNSPTPNLFNLTEPEKQAQFVNNPQKKEEPKIQEKIVEKQERKGFELPTKLIASLIPQPIKQQNQSLSKPINSQKVSTILTQKKQQILNILNQIQTKGGNIELVSKISQFTQNQLQSAKILNENLEKQKKLLEQQLRKGNEVLKSNKDQVQSLKMKNQGENCFKSIFDSINNQKSDKFPSKDAINTQMTSFISQVKQYYQHQSKISNPETQLRDLFKSILQERKNQRNLTQNQENINKENAQTLKIAEKAKTMKVSTDSFLGQRKSSWTNKNKQSLQENDDQRNNLRKLIESNRVQMSKLITMRATQFQKKRQASKISEGRTSMIMKSIIME